MSIHSHLLSISFLFLVTSTSYAEIVTDHCIAIEDEQERLHCYDSAHRSTTNSGDGDEPSNSEAMSPIVARRKQEANQHLQWFSITPHRPNYLLPIAHNTSSDYSIYGPIGERFSDTEVKFQLSLKAPLVLDAWWNSSIWAAYTQVSYWQLYAGSEASSPFRETNHEPEIMWDIPIEFNLLGFDARVASFRLNHQSNGRAGSLSRSWNRVTAGLVLEKNRYVLSAQTWARIDGESDDDNPNIEEFMGRVQLGAAYAGKRHTLVVGLKNNLRNNNRSGLEINWSIPLEKQFKFFVQIYSGYGENLIDMENNNNRIGIGVALTDWL